jgi:translation initiation factor IF-2
VPVRIYSLAKQLNLDSKMLVDICNKAGITGKGSALASLSDDEVSKVRAYIDQAKSKKSGARPAPEAKETPTQGALRREDYIPPSGGAIGKVPVLEARLPKPPTVQKQPPVQDAPVAKPPEKAPPEKAPPEKAPPVKTPAEKTPPPIKLAPMPVVERPEPTKPQEPAPQKPDIKLPLDAIRASKDSSKPLSEHLRKHEQKKAAASKKAASRRPTPAEQEAPPEKPSSGRERSRRGSRMAPDRDAEAPTLGGREHRQLKRKRAATARRRVDEEDETRTPTRRRTRIKRTGTNTAAPRKGNVVCQLPCTVREFSETIGVPAGTVLGKLMSLGTITSINAQLDPELAELLADELGVEVDFRKEVALETRLLATLQQEDDEATLKPRPPIVTFLGHVDHGKTSLLDRIIGIDVVSGEKGGITQHIRAYRVEKDGRAIAFVDTPGHEAFTEMRARGANVTDIAVLVVAADDGVMPQTEEAISHAKAADVPIVVALNKMDLPGVDPQRTYEQLAANELLPSEWGGDTELIKTSAQTGEGIEELLETLLTVAELREYKANPDRPGIGTCLEAEIQEDRGVVTKLLLQRGTLKVGDVIVCGPAYGRVKAMYDTLDPTKRRKHIGPSTPVNMTGLNVAPGAGDRFYVLEDISEARHLAEQRSAEARRRELSDVVPHVTLETLFERLGEEDQVQTLNIILRADVRGSIEAIRKELTKLEHPEVQIKILQATVGGISEADVHLADASDAVILGFNVVPDEGARILADRCGVQIRRYEIIYQVTEDLKAALEGMLKPEQQERQLGRALVQRIFQISQVGTIAGCRVLAGNIQRDSRVRVIRDNRIIGDYPLDSLKREKDDARDVREGFECGMKLRGFNDIKEGDILEAYRIEEVARTF